MPRLVAFEERGIQSFFAQGSRAAEDVQFINAPPSIDVRVGGSCVRASDVQPSNAYSSIIVVSSDNPRSADRCASFSPQIIA